MDESRIGIGPLLEAVVPRGGILLLHYRNSTELLPVQMAWWLPTSFQALRDARRKDAGKIALPTAGDVRMNSKSWFYDIIQPITSAATNTIDVSAASWTGPPTYGPPRGCSVLPYPDIVDNTEGIGAAAHVFKMRGFCRADDDGDNETPVLVLDLGGGQFDGVPNWLFEQSQGGIEVLVADPFNRSQEHNLAVQDVVESNGGADVVLSVSVLNVVADLKERVKHIALARRALKPGGRLYAFIWSGCWPERGSGRMVVDPERGIVQLNKWTAEFEPEVASVFGDSNVFVDANSNLICAVKR